MKFRRSKHNSRGKLTSKEMLDISQEISCKFSLKNTATAPELVILPVDPYHLYAYWKLGDRRSGNAPPEDADELVLRVYWRPEQNDRLDKSKLWFNVNVDSNLSQLNIRLPVDDSYYSATIGTVDENQNLAVLASSNAIHVPRARMLPAIKKPAKTETANEATITVDEKKESSKVTSENLYDEALTDAKIKEVLFKHSNPNNIDRLLTPVSITPDNSDEAMMYTGSYYDESLIDTLIQQTLYEKGLNPQLTNKAFSLETHYAASNPSGQNLLF